ncbi:Protein of unknown function [Microbacterium sp. RU33B]|nr:Protein of unknown function [Microbacterium sp. RU33B]
MLWSIAGGLLLVLLGAGIWLGVRAVQAQAELKALAPLVDDLRDAAVDRNFATIEQIADEVGTRASRAADLTGDPVWRAAEIVPFAGPNLTAVRVVSRQLAEMSDAGVQPLLDVLGVFDGASLLDAGKVDLALIEQAQAPLQRAAGTFSTAASELDALETANVIADVREAVVMLQGAVHTAADATASARDAADLLPSLLGADGPRTILLMFQNNAELRTGGGITGSFTQFDAVDGAVSLVAQASSSDFPRLADPIIETPAADVGFFGDEVGTFVQNITMTTDFAYSADLAVAWWQQRTGVTPDAVVAIDPLVIRSVIAVTGGVPLPDGTVLTADDFVETLFVDPYRTLDERQQTELQEAVTAATFEHVLQGGISPLDWIGALTEPVQEGRLSLSLSDPTAGALVSDPVLGGSGARHAAAPGDAFAVWLNDTGGGKMGTFLTTAIQPQISVCRADGLTDVTISVTLTNTAPADAASLPDSVTGGGFFGVSPGDIGTNVSVAAPKGFLSGGVTAGAERLLTVEADDRGFPTSLVNVVLAPGQTRTVDFRFTSPTAATVEPTILHTPLIEKPAVGEVTSIPCG